MTRGREAGPYDQGSQHPPFQQYPQPGPPPQQWAPPPAPPRRSRTGQTIVLVVLGLVLAGLAVGGWMARKSSPDAAAVGDCVARDGESITVVGCTDPKSAYKVVGKVEDRTQVQFSISSKSICKPFPEAKSAFWKGEAGGKGYVPCLTPRQVAPVRSSKPKPSNRYRRPSMSVVPVHGAVGQGLGAPEREPGPVGLRGLREPSPRRVPPAAGDELLEARQVHPYGAGRQQVAGLAPLDQPFGPAPDQRTAQLGDVGVQRPYGRGRRVLSPQALHQPAHRHDRPRTERQQPERAPAPPRQRNGLPGPADPQRPEHVDHRVVHDGMSMVVPSPRSAAGLRPPEPLPTCRIIMRPGRVRERVTAPGRPYAVGSGRSFTTCFMTSVEFRRCTPGSADRTSSSSSW
jgi:hypothetical protein